MKNVAERKKICSYFLIANFGLQASPKPSVMKQETPASNGKTGDAATLRIILILQSRPKTLYRNQDFYI